MTERAGPSASLPPPLVALSPGDLRGVAKEGPRLAVRLERVLDAAPCGLLLREPGLGDADFLALARTLEPVLRERGAWFALHDRPHLCAAVGATAVHLGFRSLSPRAVRDAFPELTIGRSTHAGDAVDAECVDYRFFGPFGLVEKPGVSAEHLPRRVDFDDVREAARSGPPLWVLGGVTAEDAAPLLGAGAAGVAVRSRLLGAADPDAAARAFASELGGA